MLNRSAQPKFTPTDSDSDMECDFLDLDDDDDGVEDIEDVFLFDPLESSDMDEMALETIQIAIRMAME